MPMTRAMIPSLLSQFLPNVSSSWELNSRAEIGAGFGGGESVGKEGRGAGGCCAGSGVTGGTEGFAGGGAAGGAAGGAGLGISRDAGRLTGGGRSAGFGEGGVGEGAAEGCVADGGVEAARRCSSSCTRDSSFFRSLSRGSSRLSAPMTLAKRSSSFWRWMRECTQR